MNILHTVEDCRSFRHTHRQKTLGLVPTMGALHEGHLALIRLAQQKADRVVVSIFVNPLQFGPREDFSRYPKPLDNDLAACESEGVSAVFLPDQTLMYPDAVRTLVHPPVEYTGKLCGLSRPGHFEGVATVVMKLFNIIQPDIAVFGEKDAQQLALIQKMVRDLNCPIEIIPHPIVREAGGLALSSRNRYLTTPEEQTAALILSQTLFEIQSQFTVNSKPISVPAGLQSAYHKALEKNEPAQAHFQLEYLEALDAMSLMPVDTLRAGVRIFMAGTVHRTRLIDNILLLR